MPSGDEHLRGPESRNEVWIGLGVFVVILALFATEVATDYHPGKLVGLLILVAWFPLIALHEGGHALAAWLVGWRVGIVVVGFGGTVWRTRLGSTTVEVRMFPVSGFVSTLPGDYNRPQFKEAFIYFAGPGIELLLAGLLIALVGRDEFFTASDDWLVIVAQAVGVGALFGGLTNLVPRSAVIGGRLVPTDGLGILLCAVRPKSYYRRLYGLRYDPDLDVWIDEDDDRWKGK